MRMVFRRSVVAGERHGALDAYDVAFLAGGASRVADSAIVALSERGLLAVRGSRLCAVDGERPEHPVEQVVIASCPRSRGIVAIRAALQGSPEVEKIGRRLAAWGLLTGSRRRVTRAGRRRLQEAERDGNLPAYVFRGPAALPAGSVRRGVLGAQPIPSGLGRTLIRMGKALDHDHDHYSDSGWDHGAGSDSGPGSGSDSGADSSGGFSCGGGGGNY
ncbi:TIGR04222 domain-containing membrane protein [Streptomyces turgidiscabies]|uniref:TIGR04222 domain protein n=1 Tax=Streptomyces turgidiscabies (strain Car8) TaxID=698760 RepID=L7FE97_STRT8|nr:MULTISPECIES: TIGR04222 domain-containing membrane protein [Streptomyces]ELP69431.1 hypothetical protein STRTUCAR8_07774 [Streptomyces turgidiscabies Car8]MDX3496818.1 TIGR04222 domain-containing membrane protein [Streptomyces turgidiscabies]GAQ74077.1 hypothetical protein T45_05848 [Streptomyces turgidiscabies]